MVFSNYQQLLIMLTHWFPGDFVVDFSPSVLMILIQLLLLMQLLM